MTKGGLFERHNCVVGEPKHYWCAAVFIFSRRKPGSQMLVTVICLARITNKKIEFSRQN